MKERPHGEHSGEHSRGVQRSGADLLRPHHVYDSQEFGQEDQKSISRLPEGLIASARLEGGDRLRASEAGTPLLHYLIAGMVLSSEVPLPELRPVTSGGALLSFHIGSCQGATGELMRRYEVDGDVFMDAERLEGGWRFHFPGLATFISDAYGRIVCEPYAGISSFTTRHLLIDQVVPLHLVVSRGDTVLHASAVGIFTSVGPRAVLFLGDSGVGKSTTAAGCAAAGAVLLADDFALLDLNGSRPVLVPDGVGVRLWSDVSEFMDPAVERLPVADDLDKKRIVLAGPEHLGDAGPVEIAALVWLGQRGVAEGDVSLCVPGSADAVTRVVEQSFRPNAGSAEESWHSLDRAGQLVESVPVLEVSVPASLSQLDTMCDRLLDRLCGALSLRRNWSIT